MEWNGMCWWKRKKRTNQLHRVQTQPNAILLMRRPLNSQDVGLEAAETWPLRLCMLVCVHKCTNMRERFIALYAHRIFYFLFCLPIDTINHLKSYSIWKPQNERTYICLSFFTPYFFSLSISVYRSYFFPYSSAFSCITSFTSIQFSICSISIGFIEENA